MTTQATHARPSFLTLAARYIAAKIANFLASVHAKVDVLTPRHRHRLGSWETHASFRAAELNKKTRTRLMSENG